MTIEFDVLRRVGEGLEKLSLPFMVTGSFALARYVAPRMTRDIDIVVAVAAENVDDLVGEFSVDFYVDADTARAAVRTERLFNMMHLDSGVKVDLIVRKSSEYRRVEFDRRIRANLGPVDTWLVSREDLILSKLLWSRDTASELQRRDIRQLMADGMFDRGYLDTWSAHLGIQSLLEEFLP